MDTSMNCVARDPDGMLYTRPCGDVIFPYWAICEITMDATTTLTPQLPSTTGKVRRYG